jgi:hypothetical protein
MKHRCVACRGSIQRFRRDGGTFYGVNDFASIDDASSIFVPQFLFAMIASTMIAGLICRTINSANDGHTARHLAAATNQPSVSLMHGAMLHPLTIITEAIRLGKP